MGNKSKLVTFIKKIIQENCPVIDSLCDLFAGTGSVGQAFNTENTRIIANDHLMSNYCTLSTFLLYDNRHAKKLHDKILYLNSLKPKTDNYFSKRYGGTFFTLENARKIGLVRNTIEKIFDTIAEKHMLIASLIYAMDKLANTVGHYDAYRKIMDCTNPIVLCLPKLETRSRNHNNVVSNRDANELVYDLDSDVLYLDPPYNSRQYCDAYHLLENVASWRKPSTYGKAQKMIRGDKLKSQYCLKDAAQAFQDLILNSRSKHIFLSYNNTGYTRHDRSNSKIDDVTIKKILRKKGKLMIFETQYSEFTTGKSTSMDDHLERIFYCKVV